MTEPLMRRGRPADAERIVAIWRDGINLAAEIHAADAEEPVSYFRTRLENTPEGLGYWVLEVEGRVVGWQSLLPFYPSPLEWRYLAISSTYVERRCGVPDAGLKLVSGAAEEARRAGVAQLFAVISAKNRASIRMAKRAGWHQCGTIPVRFRGPVRMELQLFVLTFRDTEDCPKNSPAQES
jgi:L-amino acid N-acyltransferase YncA